jgi:hypothetical protein
MGDPNRSTFSDKRNAAGGIGFLRNYKETKFGHLRKLRNSVYTAKTKCQKFETNIPRKGISGPQSQFPHSCVCELIIYSHAWVCLFCWRKYVDRSCEYINRSQIQECGNRS